ncbi:MAG: flavodoxin domain-containing protein [Anaerolineae bacterium]|nr:flavodoxin domain-containing protein [Anaerolineae bacterium]
MDRRQFLKTAGFAVGGAALSCAGLGFVATRKPALTFAEGACTGGGGQRKALVAYASKAGATGEVAEAIQDVLCAGGLDVDLRLATDVTDVNTYDAVVVGSAIRTGQWLGEAIRFVETHQTALRTMPVALFTVCMTLEIDTEANRQKVLEYMDPVLQMIPADHVGLFAGVMDYAKLSFLERMVIKVIGTPEGDFRDWPAIRTWAGNLLPAFQAG